MKEFFIEILQSLKPMRGLNQFEDFKSRGDAGREDLKTLLNTLLDVCGKFPYLPDQVKKATIRQRILDDPELYSLTGAKIWLWLNQASQTYNHTTEPVKVSGMACNEVTEATKQLIEDFKKELANSTGFKPVPAVTKTDIERIKMDDGQKQGKSLSKNVKLGTHEDYELNQKKIEWARENTDLYTGRLKPDGIRFEEWLKLG